MEKSIVEELDGMHQSMLEYVKSKMQGKTWADFETCELSDIVDMIKDLSEAKYYEACAQIKMGKMQPNAIDLSITNDSTGMLPITDDRALIEASMMQRRNNQQYMQSSPRYQQDDYLMHGMNTMRASQYDRDYYQQRYPQYYDQQDMYSGRNNMRNQQYGNSDMFYDRMDDMRMQNSQPRTTTSSSND